MMIDEHNLSELCYLSYRSIERFIERSQKMGFKFINKYRQTDTGADFYLLDINDELVICFRGTEVFDLKDIVTNIRPKGFKLASEKCLKMISHIVSLYKRVTITGHSLGGAVSHNMGLLISSMFPEIELSVISFGAPRSMGITSMIKYLSLMKSNRINSKRFVIPEDVVPLLKVFCRHPHKPIRLLGSKVRAREIACSLACELLRKSRILSNHSASEYMDRVSIHG